MIQEGQYAPDFELYGIKDDQRKIYRLDREVRDGNVVLLMFYPMDFSPVCTAQLCSIRDADWFAEVPDLSVWGISASTLYCHREFASKYDLNYPILMDQGAEVADRYDVKYDWWDGHVDVPKRALFLIDRDQQVRYAWSSDDAYVNPDFDPIDELLPDVVEVSGSDFGGGSLDHEADYAASRESRLD